MLQLSAEEPAGEARDRWRAPAWSWLVGSLLIVITPIVVAAVRAVASGYRPVGDDGLLLVRIRDVGTSHTPLLGSWTSASLSGKVNFNNPGPIYFDLVAPAVKVLGPWAGLVIGAMLVNAAAAVVSIVVAERVAGRAGLIAATATVAALEWTLGSAVLIDVWQPNALVLPAFAYVVCLWALASGWRWALPFVVGLASLLIQTHVGYTYLVALSLVGVVALCVWQERTARAPNRHVVAAPAAVERRGGRAVLDPVGDRAADLRRPGQPQPDLVGVTWGERPRPRVRRSPSGSPLKCWPARRSGCAARTPTRSRSRGEAPRWTWSGPRRRPSRSWCWSAPWSPWGSCTIVVGTE